MTGRGELYEATRDLHHACEQHPVGASMSDGKVSEQVWTDWLGCLATVHAFLDWHLPPELRRVARLRKDIHVMASRGFQPASNHAALRYAAIGLHVEAATYVFTGAHLMGGAVMEKRLGERLPCNHLRWDDRRASLDLWRPYREAEGISEFANDVFAAILQMMEEIDARY
jgi:hypothetical protein